MSRLIVGVVSIYDHTELLPHFLEHYRGLGLSELFVAVRGKEALRAAERAIQAAGFGRTHFRPARLFSDTEKVEVEESVLAAEGIRPDDYVLHLDLDEFHEYPASLEVLAGEMDRRGDLAVSGTLVDRIASKGGLAPVLPQPSIWEQFPVAADLTAAVLRGCTRKVMICRRSVQLSDGGRHDAVDAVHERQPIPGSYIVHHFKWTEGIDRRLGRRLSRDTLVEPYRDECRRFLEYLCRCGGQIDLNDARLNARYPRPQASHVSISRKS